MFHLHFFHIPKLLSAAYGKKVCKALEAVIQIPQEGIVNLIAVPPEEIAWMNEQYRGKEGPTDILTFSYFKGRQKAKGKRQKEGARTPPRFSEAPSVGERRGLGGVEKLVIGEIYLCPEKIRAYTKGRGVTYREQLEYILIHGLVHLVGLDHETAKDAKQMEEVEGKIKKIMDNPIIGGGRD